MRLALFINQHREEILAEWDAFAKTLVPEATPAELRNHAKQILRAIELDLQTVQSGDEQAAKSKGMNEPLTGADESAASVHGWLREGLGFTLPQITAEFRALRASVLRLWLAQLKGVPEEHTADLMRFNEAVDQALSESVIRYGEHSDQTHQKFLAILSHDLRTPLSSILLAGEYLLSPEAQQLGVTRTGETVTRNASQISILVTDLLDFSRTRQMGKLPIKKETIDLKQVCEHALHDANAAYPECPFSFEASGDTVGSFDASRMQQLLTNLLVNAAQHRDTSYPVKLTLEGQPNEIKLQVENRGPIIPEGFLDKIFEPMLRLENGVLEGGGSGEGLGIGLFIAREIAQGHGGTISVASTMKSGTLFTVLLPRS